MKKCPFCKKEIAVSATECPICKMVLVEKIPSVKTSYNSSYTPPKEKEVKHINAYLVASEDVFIESKRTPICNVPEIIFGSMPNDGGNFLFTEEEKNQFIGEEPGAEKYIKIFMGGDEFINNIKRYCLWLKDIAPENLKNLKFVLERVKKVKEQRQESKREETKKLANYPTLFGEIRQPSQNYIIIPLNTSSERKYIPIGMNDKNIIASNLVSIIPTSSLYIFGVLQSELHMTWVNFVCGRLGNGYRYSNTLVYNNFPWPEKVSDEHKRKVEECAQKVLNIRLEFPDSSLADLYDPNTMPPELVEAHSNLDRAVDASYGRKFSNKEERIEFLFELYKKYTKQKSA